MVLRKRTEAQERINQIKTLFPLNQKVTIKFSKFMFKSATILDVKLAKLTELRGVPTPDKRILDGKQYTPFVVEVILDQGILRFILDDTEFTAILHGVCIETGKNRIDIRKES